MIAYDANNVRTHDDKNKAAINKSLAELGAGRSILIDADDTAIAGNGVLAEAERLGIPIQVVETDGGTLIAVKRTDLHRDDARRKALAIADNRTSDLSEFDDDLLNAALAELQESSDVLDIEATGFDEEEIIARLSEDETFGNTSTDRNGQDVSSTWGQVKKAAGVRVIIGPIEMSIKTEIADRVCAHLCDNYQHLAIPISEAFESVLLQGMGNEICNT